ncbi:hypothetical protein BJV77DRAFT_1065171 [Russula vinacea]|nr:hypothetical protein BJV77DRAFT_1065171 [Russula vinacea]
MSGRQGGKVKPLKLVVGTKGNEKGRDEEDIAFKAKKKAEAEALKAAKKQALKGGPPGGGIKK